VKVEIASEASPELVAAFERLIPQLSRSNPPPTIEQLAEIVASPATDVIVARDDDGTVLGSLTLAVFRIPTALRAWIEDVVVDESARGKGVASALNTFALDRARELGCATVDLTSRPGREAANRLYQRLGFVQRETNVYRYELE
jgi:ribosomal protein S18 acetylase RimI-like enzyme